MTIRSIGSAGNATVVLGRRAALMGGIAAGLAGCGLARGSALQSEILMSAGGDDSGVQVVPVTRESQREIAQWPIPPQHTRLHWLTTGSSQGPLLVRSGDTINLRIWDSQRDSLVTSNGARNAQMESIVVSPSGDVFIPYIGEFRIAGMTADQARRDIQERLTSIIPDAQVQLVHQAGQNNTIDVVSGVQRPGQVPVGQTNQTLMSVISASGGISQSINNPVIQLHRAGQAYAIHAQRLFSEPAANIAMRGGDRIVVEPDRRAFVALGATGRQQIVPFTNDQISALDALSMIGGLSQTRADLRGLMILREYPASQVRPTGNAPKETQVIFTFDLSNAGALFAARNFDVLNEDVILATEAPLPAVAQVVGTLRSIMLLGQ